MKIRMYTQSNAYLRKTSSSLLLALLLFSALLAFLPIAVVHGSTGTVDLGTVNNLTASATYTAAVSFVNVTAGSATAKNDCTSFPCNAGYFAINFNAVDFSGSQFKLYLSTNGFSQINTTAGETSDVLMTSNVFNVGALSGAFGEIGTTGYYTGTLGADKIVAGPLPIDISNKYHFIKVYDGSSSSVAASIKEIAILPGVTLTPTSGPAGTMVTAQGGGFPEHATIDLTYSYYLQFWNGTSKLYYGNWTTGISTGLGFWTSAKAMVDVMQQINPPETPILTVPISIQAALQAVPHTTYGVPAIFNETSAFVTQVVSFDTSGHAYDTTTAPYSNMTMYGSYNGSTGSGVTTFWYVNTVSGGTLTFAGNDSLVNGAVTIWVDGHLNVAKNGVLGGTKLTTATATNNGHFNVTATLTSLSVGYHYIFISLGGDVMWFQIYVWPSLTVNPTQGPVGQHVIVTAAGFPANSAIYLYWYQYSWDDYTYYNLANATTGTTGAFNVTVVFTAHNAYGGAHFIAASTTYAKNPYDYFPGTDIAYTYFTILPTLVICTSSTNCGTGSTNVPCSSGTDAQCTVSVNANTRTILNATGTGFGYTECGGGCWYDWYQVNIDNAIYSNWDTYVNGNGFVYVNFTAAGFQPGLHQVEFYSCYYYDDYNPCVGAPVAVAYFNVTTIGAYISGGSGGGLSSSTISEINSIYTNVNTILGWGTTITTISTNVNNINTNVETILGWRSTILSINSTVNGLKTTLGTIQTTLGTITTDLGTITTNLGTVLTSANNAATQATAAANAANNAKTSVSDTETYVLVVAVLAAITLVLELAILVRKLD